MLLSRPWAARAVALELVAVSFYVVFVARSAFVAAGTRSFTLFDDAMISLTYARTLADGGGLRWFPGAAPVEGYTNFLWTLVLAAIESLGIGDLHVALAVMVVGVVLLVATAVIVWALAGRLGLSGPASTIALAATAFAYPLVFWTLRGMEVGLIALLLVAAVLLCCRLDERPSGRDVVVLCGVLAAAVLTRTEAIAYAAVVVGYLGWCHRPRGALAVAGTTSVVLAAHTAFRLAYYGEPFPNTYTLKVTGHPLGERLDRGASTLAHAIGAQLWGMAALAVIVLVVRGRGAGRRVALLYAMVGTSLVYSVYVGGDAWEWAGFANRYVAVTLPLLGVLAAIAVDAIPNASRERLLVASVAAAVFAGLFVWHRSTTPRAGVLAVLEVACVALFPLAFVVLWLLTPRAAGRATVAIAASLGAIALAVADARPLEDWVETGGLHVRDDAAHARLGLALRAATSPDARIAVVWAGAVPFFAHRASIDLLGKSDPVVARLPPHEPFSPGHDKWDYRYSIGRLRPDVVVDLWRPSAADFRLLREDGYVLVDPSWFRPSARVDLASFRSLHALPPVLARRPP